MRLQRSMWYKLRARFKRDEEKSLPKNITCANCETNFDGNFCPNCGQSIKDFDRPLSFVVYNFLGDFFAFDTRFFRSITTLLFKPGKLSKEYIEGRRVRYAPPFRIYVFVSFLLFLLLQIYTNRGLSTVLDSDIREVSSATDSVLVSIVDSIANEGYSINDFKKIKSEQNDSVITEKGIQIGAASNTADVNFKLGLETFRKARNLRNSLNIIAGFLEQKLEKEEDPQEKVKLREQISVCRSPEQAMAKILKYMSWVFFLLLPIFAVVLKLVYVRRKHNYMRHLVFSIHVHAFIFVVMILIVAFYMSALVHVTPIVSVLFLTIPVYSIIALKKFYGQSLGKTILKFIIVSNLYFFIFSVLFVGTVLNALSII